MSDSSPTPDLLPGFQKGSRLDKAERSGARDNASVVSGAREIRKSPSGPKCHLDGPASGLGAPRGGGSLGTGGDSLSDASRSIASGSKTPQADWSHLKRGGK